MAPLIAKEIADSPSGQMIIKWSIIGTIAVVLAVALYFIIKKTRGSNRTANNERQINQLINAAVEQGAKSPCLTDAQVDTIATNIYESCKGPGTDEDLLIDSFESIPTAADYLRVKAAFARLKEEKNWWFTAGDMAVTVRDDVDVDSDTDLKIMRHLASIGVSQL